MVQYLVCMICATVQYGDIVTADDANCQLFCQWRCVDVRRDVIGDAESDVYCGCCCSCYHLQFYHYRSTVAVRRLQYVYMSCLTQ